MMRFIPPLALAAALLCSAGAWADDERHYRSWSSSSHHDWDDDRRGYHREGRYCRDRHHRRYHDHRFHPRHPRYGRYHRGRWYVPPGHRHFHSDWVLSHRYGGPYGYRDHPYWHRERYPLRDSHGRVIISVPLW